MRPGVSPDLEHIRARAIEMVATGMRATEIAATLGVHVDTVRDWAHEEGFRRNVDAITEEARQRVGQRISDLAGKALRTMEEILDDPDAERWARLRAAESILSRGGFGEAKAARTGPEGGFGQVADLFQQRLAGAGQPPGAGRLTADDRE